MPKRKQIGHKASVERPNSFIKKSIITFLGIGILLYPLICFSSYIIHLKDGRKFTTDLYYEEGDQLKFKIFGGVMGIQKDQVKEIEEIEDLPEEKAEAVKQVTVGEEKRSKEGEAVEPLGKPENGEATLSEPSKGEASGKTPTPEGSNKPKNIILKEFDRLKEEFEFVELMPKEKLYQFDKDLMVLKSKIIKAGLAGVYTNQLTEILSMGDKLEKTLKEKD